MPERPSSFRVPKCLECLSTSSAQVSFECPSASSPQVPWVPKCSSPFECLEYLECLSAQVPEWLECLRCSSARVPWVPWGSKCLSKSVSQSASKSAGVQYWFSKLISNLRAPILREDLFLQLRKLDLIWNSSLIKLKSHK